MSRNWAEWSRALFGSDVPHTKLKQMFPKAWSYTVAQGLVNDVGV